LPRRDQLLIAGHQRTGPGAQFVSGYLYQHSPRSCFDAKFQL
jgi:hypothetical protein